MNKAHFAIALLCLSSSFALSQTQAPAQPQGPEQPQFIQQGNQLAKDGKLQEALQLYGAHLDNPADAFAANIAVGNTLDLMGDGHRAKVHFAKALEIA